MKRVLVGIELRCTPTVPRKKTKQNKTKTRFDKRQKQTKHSHFKLLERS